MEELDDEFGVADLVTEKLKKDREEHYTARNLRGMRVEHSTDHFRQQWAGDKKDVDQLRCTWIRILKFAPTLIRIQAFSQSYLINFEEREPNYFLKKHILP